MQNFKYLTLTDFNSIIQPSQLEYQLVQNNIQTLFFAENVALAEASSLLQGRYSLEQEFIPLLPWSYNATYSAGQRVILDYATYSTGVTYSIGQCVIIPNSTVYDNSDYDAIGECWCLTGTNSISGTFSSSYWTDLGQQYSIFNASYPAPYFNYLNSYQKGDIVYWAGYTWSCALTTPIIDQTEAMQFVNINAVPRNPLPTDPINNNGTFWIRATQSYVIPINTLPTNTTYWQFGDNRSALMVLHIMSIVLYYLHMNIQPTNVPELRIKCYKYAMEYFKDLIEGKKNSPILLLQPNQGDTVRFGGQVRKNQLW